MIRKLDDQVSVAPQITPEDLADIASRGFVRVVNNRPDGEEAGQPDSSTIRTAAEQAGLDYVAIPIAHGFAVEDIDAMAEAIDMPGPMLAFCRSGARSTHLWALARARAGESVDAVIAAAGDAGYDLAAMRPILAKVGSGR